MAVRPLFLFGVGLGLSGARPADFVVDMPPSNEAWRFAFASCHDFPTPRFTHRHPGNGGNILSDAPFDWDVIRARGPGAMIWVGDTIYGDFPKDYSWVPKPLSYFLPELPIWSAPFVASSGRKLTAMYDGLKADAGFKTLLSSLGPGPRHFGTWDDHDFGLNDGDRTMRYKDESKDAFLRFYDAPASDPRRQRDGIYSSTIFRGPNTAVLVIALDMRFSKDPYGVGSDGDFLGAEQWAWLEETLEGSRDANATVFLSSLQLLPLHREKVSECWNIFPAARARFLQLLQGTRRPLVVSGDVHFAELLQATCGEEALVELTTSGLTHSWGDGMGMMRQESRWLASAVMTAFQLLMPWTFQTRSSLWHRDFYLGRNFGELEFDWASHAVSARVLDGRSGAVTLERSWPLVDLVQGRRSKEHPEPCRAHRGDPSALRVALGMGGVVLFALSLLLLKPALWAAALYGVVVLRRRAGMSIKAKGE